MGISQFVPSQQHGKFNGNYQNYDVKYQNRIVYQRLKMEIKNQTFPHKIHGKVE